MDTFSLTPDGLDCVDLQEGLDKNVDVSNLCIVGKILAPKNLNKTTVLNIIQGAWKTRAKLIQVHGVPVAKLTRQNGEIIGWIIGNLIGVEALHDGLLLERSSLWLRVEVDVSKLLHRGFIPQQHGPEDKESWVSYKYEKLSDFCYDCGRLGHDNSPCKFVSRDEGKKSGYGPKLRTSRALRLDILAKQVRHWVDVAEERVRNLVSQRLVTMSTDDACKTTHKSQNNITDPADTASTADLEVDTGHVEANPPRRATPLRSDVVSISGNGCGRDGQPVLANEVVVGSTKSSVGHGLQYFVIEPVDNNLLVKATHNNESGTGPFYEIGIKEISLNSSPTKVSFVNQTIDKCMASFFKDLPIKQKASEALVDTSQPKRSKVSVVGATGTSHL
ncbi:hypothetical protein ACSBR2_018444 [Camellia fascicularis]